MTVFPVSPVCFVCPYSPLREHPLLVVLSILVSPSLTTSARRACILPEGVQWEGLRLKAEIVVKGVCALCQLGMPRNFERRRHHHAEKKPVCLSLTRHHDHSKCLPTHSSGISNPASVAIVGAISSTETGWGNAPALTISPWNISGTVMSVSSSVP